MSQATEDRARAPRWRVKTQVVLSRRGRLVSRFGKNHVKSTTWTPSTRRRAAWSRPTAQHLDIARHARPHLAVIVRYGARVGGEVGVLTLWNNKSYRSPRWRHGWRRQRPFSRATGGYRCYLRVFGGRRARRARRRHAARRGRGAGGRTAGRPARGELARCFTTILVLLDLLHARDSSET